MQVQAKQVLGFSLSPGHAHDASVGRDLLTALGVGTLQIPLIMDRAYEGNETRYLVQSLGFEPVVQPKENRVDPWPLDTELYKRRNAIERLFGRIKRFQRVSTHDDKTDLIFCAFVTIAFIADQLRCATRRWRGRVQADGATLSRAASRRVLSASRLGQP